MEFILFVVCIVFFVINLVIASYMEDVAFSKGYDKSAHAFGRSFWFGIAGWLYVIALPDLVARANQEKLIEQQEKMISNFCNNSKNSGVISVTTDDELPPL